MYLRVAIPSYRHTDDSNLLNERNALNSDFPFPSNELPNSSGQTKSTKGHVVYQLEVVSNNFGNPEYETPSSQSQVQLGQGRVFRLEKRYSAFLALHNELRKHYTTPEFPPKRLKNTSQKVISIRRQQLEAYMQYVVKIAPVPKVLMDFLQVSEQYSSNGFDNQNEVIFYAPDETTDPSDYSCQHQPVLGFKNKEPFLYDTNELSFHSSSRGQNRLPDIVTQATLECFYST